MFAAWKPKITSPICETTGLVSFSLGGSSLYMDITFSRILACDGASRVNISDGVNGPTC
jgi:hypothetical protein